MADPFTVASFGMAASGAGAGLGAIGSLMSGGAKSAQYKYQSGVAKMNADIARQNAEFAIQAGESEARQSGMKTGATIAARTARAGASGIDISSGSPAQVAESVHSLGLEDQSIIRENAGRKAYGQLVEAATQDANAKMYSKASSTAKTAGYIGAASSILGGLSSVSSKWLQASQLGMMSSRNPTILGEASYYEEPGHESGSAYG